MCWNIPVIFGSPASFSMERKKRRMMAKYGLCCAGIRMGFSRLAAFSFLVLPSRIYGKMQEWSFRKISGQENGQGIVACKERDDLHVLSWRFFDVLFWILEMNAGFSSFVLMAFSGVVFRDGFDGMTTIQVCYNGKTWKLSCKNRVVACWSKWSLGGSCFWGYTGTGRMFSVKEKLDIEYMKHYDFSWTSKSTVLKRSPDRLKSPKVEIEPGNCFGIRVFYCLPFTYSLPQEVFPENNTLYSHIIYTAFIACFFTGISWQKHYPCWRWIWAPNIPASCHIPAMKTVRCRKTCISARWFCRQMVLISHIPWQTGEWTGIVYEARNGSNWQEDFWSPSYGKKCVRQALCLMRKHRRNWMKR